MNRTILIVDDRIDIQESTIFGLKSKGYRTITTHTASSAIDFLKFRRIHAVLLDLYLSSGNGISVLQYLSTRKPDLPVLILTDHGSPSPVIGELKRKEGFFYLRKPVDLNELLTVLANLPNPGKVRSMNKPAFTEEYGIIGRSPLIAKSLSAIEKIASTDYNVLISGESGTGKELVARALHSKSLRCEKPLISVNCAALSETLFHGEMFGYKKGSFTGAVASHDGYFHAANGGSIFLDEIGEITQNTQVTLLRVLETKEYNPIGHTSPRKVDVRVICATNKNLERESREGKFRLDLFYRLNVFHIQVPPLRERREDIPLLVAHFLNKHRNLLKREGASFSEEVIRRFMEYDWPGNIRQLENIVIRGLVAAHSEIITMANLPDFRRQSGATAGSLTPPPEIAEEELNMKGARKNMLYKALLKEGGCVAKAATVLGISRATMYRLIRKHQIDLKEFRAKKGG
ncbi:MAG: sigma-54-dependent Fis family transcriptional regulator [Nitrospinae bacterium]|nr:sigma-54-dependent Fis family transcriptional regulator [Nitrospinota bacterium]